MLPFVTFCSAVVMETKSVIFYPVFPAGIDIFKKICYIATRKAVTKTRGHRKMPREEAILLRGFCTPALTNTTSELYVRKCHTGCARYCVNEWLCRAKQPGWNRGIHLYPTPDLSGAGIFYTFPQISRREYYVRRKSVHL